MGITVKGKKNGTITGEDLVENSLRNAVRMILGQREGQKVGHVDHAEGKVGKMSAKKIRRRQNLKGRDIARTGQHERRGVGLPAFGPAPAPETGGGMTNRLVQAEPGRHGLLSGNDEIDPVTTRQGVTTHGQECVRIGCQVDPNVPMPAVEDVVDESRPLMAIAVVVLTPGVRCQENVERRKRTSPRDLIGRFEPFHVLVDHAVDDRGKSLVTGEEPVSTRENVTLEPPFTTVFGKDFEHTPLGAEVIILGSDGLESAAISDFKNGVEPVRNEFVRTEKTEIRFVGTQNVPKPHPERTGGFHLPRSR